MITKRETNLSQLMIFLQVVLTIFVFLSIELFFPQQVFNLVEKAAMLIQIILIWGIFFNKFRLGIVFRTSSLVSMIRGYVVTIFFGSLFLFLEVELIPQMREIKFSIEYMTLFAFTDLVALFLFKFTFYWVMKFIRRKGYNSRKVILIADSTAIPFIDSFIKAKD